MPLGLIPLPFAHRLRLQVEIRYPGWRSGRELQDYGWWISITSTQDNQRSLNWAYNWRRIQTQIRPMARTDPRTSKPSLARPGAENTIACQANTPASQCFLPAGGIDGKREELSRHLPATQRSQHVFLLPPHGPAP